MKRNTLMIVILLALCFTACQKEEDDNNNNNLYSATEDMALAENLFSDIFTQVGDAATNTQDSLGKIQLTALNSCATLTITPFDGYTWPKTLTLDFGSTNCLGNDFRYRRGKIIANTTDWWSETGCVVTVTFDQYFVNDYQILGTKTITNMGRNADNHLVYHLSYPDGQFIKPNNGGTINWHTERDNVWVEGENTAFYPWDDVYMVSGNAGGTTANGTNYTFQIVQDLNVLIGCRWIRAGVIDATFDSYPTVNIDFGNGVCDEHATVYILNQPFQIIMN